MFCITLWYYQRLDIISSPSTALWCGSKHFLLLRKYAFVWQLDTLRDWWRLDKAWFPLVLVNKVLKYMFFWPTSTKSQKQLIFISLITCCLLPHIMAGVDWHGRPVMVGLVILFFSINNSKRRGKCWACLDFLSLVGDVHTQSSNLACYSLCSWLIYRHKQPIVSPPHQIDLSWIGFSGYGRTQYKESSCSWGLWMASLPKRRGRHGKVKQVLCEVFFRGGGRGD